MTNKVLVPIDTTGISELALAALSVRAIAEGTEVLVLAVIEPLMHSNAPQSARGYYPEMQARMNEDRSRARAALEEAQKAIRSQGMEASTRLAEGEIPETIVNVAAEWGADLIVMTSHPRKGIARFFHRSVAEGVVHRSPCSVFVVKGSDKKAAA